MNWLSQNWVWLALVVGFVLLVSRRGGMAGCGMGGYRRHRAESPSTPSGPSGGTAFDPVSLHPVPAAGATVSSVYRGRVYYFENRENRDSFEADPEKHLAAAGEVGQAVDPRDEAGYRHHHRHHGC